VTENHSVKEALMQNLDTLKETLSRQNISMERFNVSTDLRQGFHQGTRDERQLTQGDRGSNAAFQPATADEEPALQKFQYGWDNDNSLVSLML
jgi:flagellar hook-length control protein FliK